MKCSGSRRLRTGAMPACITPSPKEESRMNRYEGFRLGILGQAYSATSQNHYIMKSSWGLANQYGIPERHVCEELIRLAASGLISLSAWDGERERPYDEWPTADALFSNTTDGGHVRIRLLSPGGELLSKTPKSPIGFNASGGRTQ